MLNSRYIGDSVFSAASTIQAGPNVIKLFLSVIYEFSHKCSVRNKTRAYPSEPPFRYSTNRAGSQPYPQTLDQAGKACQEQTLQLITKICKLQTKKFYNIGIWSRIRKTSYSSQLADGPKSQSISRWRAFLGKCN